MPDRSSLSPGQALGRWVLYVLVFLLGGGVAAGISAMAYEAISQSSNPVGLYAVVFAVSGFIAYQLAERVVNTPDT